MSESIQNPNPLPPHPIPSEAEPFLASMTKEERELHELAVKMLGSSYFIERCHAFRKWKASQKADAKPSAK